MPCVMKCRVSQSLSRPSISASTSTQARPAAALMRLRRLSGRKREYLASKAWTQPETARSKAVACGSPAGAAYWMVQLVPSAAKSSRRNGTSAATLGTAGGGVRWERATKAMGFSIWGCGIFDFAGAQDAVERRSWQRGAIFPVDASLRSE